MASTKTTDTLIIIAGIGGSIAVNLVIAGLILIALVHDGATGQAIAATFQTALTALIGVAGTIIGSVFTGRIVHTAGLSSHVETEINGGAGTGKGTP